MVTLMQELRTVPRQRRSQQSIDAILDAAERLIHDQGQVSFTANELAVEASMSIGRVYYWFPDMPSVVTALAERATQRLGELFDGLKQYAPTDSAPMLLRETISTLCEHIDANPSTVALCLSGSGPLDYGTGMRQRVVSLAGALLRERVPGLPDIEAELVANTAVDITLGMLHEYLGASLEHRPYIQQELVYVLSSWLYSRYPQASHVAWADALYPIQPSRMPLKVDPRMPVYPALSPLQHEAAIG